MSPFTALRKFFTSSVDGHVPMNDAFVQIDRDEWAKRLKLRERGEEQGKLERPNAEDTAFDAVEQELIAAINAELNSAQIEVHNHTSAFQNRLADLKLLHEVGTIRAATIKATGDFETLVIDWRNRLSNRRDAIVESYHDLKNFKAENRLTRPTFEVPSKVVTFGSIALAGLIEVFGNAVFLRVNDDLGFLGGIFAAIMVAAVNIGLAVAAGYFFWPKMNLRSPKTKVVFGSLIAAWLLIVLVWNLLAGHYRDAKSMGVADPQGLAAELLRREPFGLDGIYSWGLFIIGVIAALVAARSAYRMDDPFPGYGDRGRQHRQRCEEYAEEVGAANRELTGVRDEAINDASDVKQQLGVQFRERGRIEDAFRRFVARFEQHESHLEQIANSLLAIYRDANLASRTTPAPARFGERFRLKRSEVAPLHIQQLSQSEIDAAEKALSDCIDQVDAAFRHSIGRFEPLDTLKAELERGAV